jgi:hypothetical protein
MRHFSRNRSGRLKHGLGSQPGRPRFYLILSYPKLDQLASHERQIAAQLQMPPGQ